MPQTVFASNAVPPQLIAIAQCESGGKQFNADGTVVENPITHDYGLFQIHESWLPTAKKMGLDVINSPMDNIEFALWLSNKDPGFTDWSASKKCWDSS